MKLQFLIKLCLNNFGLWFLVRPRFILVSHFKPTKPNFLFKSKALVLDRAEQEQF